MPHFAQNWPSMPKPIRPPKRSWKNRLAAFGVHFLCGALLGATCGVGVWALLFSDLKTATVGGACLGGGALLGGIVAGIARAEFWDRFRKAPPERGRGAT